ncbi:MAG: phosphoesterase PA-phosphatase related protein [Frankiales bacterium]|nr:phosphoesterase PA-phosphatase related protein [Frankiales bacterium]
MDSDLFRVVNDFAKDTPWLHGLATFYAGVAGPALLALLVLLAVVWSRAWETSALAKSVWAGLAPVIAIGLNQPLVRLINRPRPFATLDHVLVLAHRSADGGLPSDHGTLAGAVLAALFLADRKLGWAATGVGVLLAASRVYVGVHYPGDVLAGLAFGALVAVVGWAVVGGLLTRLLVRLRLTRLRPLLTA